MSRVIEITDSVTLHPSGYDSSNSSYSSVSSSYPISNGYDSASSTNYAYITCTTGSRAESHISYTFNVSSVPQDATIDSISCSVKTRVSSTQYLTASTIQLYSGSTAKGSSTSAASTTATARSISSTGSWTRAELDNIQVRLTGTRGTSNTSRAAYLYFYGADLTINYSISGTAYTVTANSLVSGITVDPTSEEFLAGSDCVVKIYTETLEGISVTDNGTDISSELDRKEVPSGGTIAAVPESYTVSGSISGTRYQSTVGHGVDNPSSQTGNDYCSSSGSTATIYYRFNFDELPDEATIESMTVQAYGHLENSSQSSEVAELNTYYGTTAKGTTTEYTSTTAHLVTIPAGTWTVAQLKDDARVGFTIGYYGGLTTGITWTVVYSMPGAGSYYYEYAINNISADHAILVEEAGPYVPPEEDPTKTYWPITISSINADTDPNNGTTRVEQGTNQTITITPTDPQLTLALDNGVDITSQLVGGVPTNTYTIDTQVSGASYGFELNSSTGYYVSTNNGVNKSASVARINLSLESDCLVTITYINYAEADYDYGMFGKLDTEVATDGLTAGSNGSSPSDSTSNYQLAKCSNSQSTQTITYQVSMGEHFIDVKYGKDDASDSGNDSLQWKVTSIEATSAGGDYTYTLTNITQKHSLVFVFGNVEYYFVTSTGNCKLFPDGQQVKLAGDSYLINIVPNNTTDTVTITDNNIDVTSQLERYEGTKSGQTVVSYQYGISDIAAAHNLVITSSGGGTVLLWAKIGGSYASFSKAYVKVNGAYVLQSDLTKVFDNNHNYIYSST